MGGLRQGGEVIVFGGSVHQSFTDAQAYLSATGRGLLGDGARPEAVDDITWQTSDVITAFAGPYLGGPAGPSLDQVLACHPSVREERHVRVRTT